MSAFDKYTNLRAARSSSTPTIRAVTPPANCTRAWVIRSNRGWYAMHDKATSNGRQVPFLVEQGGELYIVTAVAKMLEGNAFWSQPDKRIGRKGFHHLTQKRLDAIVNGASYGCDGFFRAGASAHVSHDTIDVGIWLRELTGRPIEGGWDGLVAIWESGEQA